MIAQSLHEANYRSLVGRASLKIAMNAVWYNWDRREKQQSLSLGSVLQQRHEVARHRIGRHCVRRRTWRHVTTKAHRVRMHVRHAGSWREILDRIRSVDRRRRHVHGWKRRSWHRHASRRRWPSRELSCKLPELSLLLNSRSHLGYIRSKLLWRVHQRCRGIGHHIHSRRSDMGRSEMHRG